MTFFAAFILGSAFGMILYGVLLAKVSPAVWESIARRTLEVKEDLAELTSLQKKLEGIKSKLKTQFLCEKCGVDIKPNFLK